MINKIKEFVNLKKNWDSYNACLISEDAISTAIMLVDVFSLNDLSGVGVFPMRSGGIQFEIEKENKSFEVLIDSIGRIEFIKYDLKGNRI